MVTKGDKKKGRQKQARLGSEHKYMHTLQNHHRYITKCLTSRFIIWATK